MYLRTWPARMTGSRSACTSMEFRWPRLLPHNRFLPQPRISGSVSSKDSPTEISTVLSTKSMFSPAPSPALNSTAAASLSMDAWVRVDSVPANTSVLVEKRAPGSRGYVLALEGTNAGVLAGRIGFTVLTDNVTAFASVESTASIADGQFHHIATTLDRATNILSLYLDGVLVSTASATTVGDLTTTGRFF